VQAIQQVGRAITGQGFSRSDVRPREKGIIITTGTFTAEARREATRDGAPPVEVIDGDKLVDMLERFELGLHPVTTYEIDGASFNEFRS
jgi:restriction system protein